KQRLDVLRQAMHYLLQLTTTCVIGDDSQNSLDGFLGVDDAVRDNFLLRRHEKFLPRHFDWDLRWFPSFVVKSTDQHWQLGTEMDGEVHRQSVAQSLQHRSQ